MYHTLKSLYNHTAKHYPKLTNEFDKLENYCYDADELHHQANYNRGYNSLKWFIYSLRPHVEKKQLEDVFFALLTECTCLHEDVLFDQITCLYTYDRYKHLIAGPLVQPEDLPTIEIRGWSVLINETSENITGLAFKRKVADVIIINDRKSKSAAYVFNERDTSVLNDFDVNWLHDQLRARGEAWHKQGNNLLICGGPKFPENTTIILISEMVELLKRA